MKDQAYNNPPFHFKDSTQFINDTKKRFQRENEQLLTEIISDIGWPTQSKVGKKASSTAFLIVQHSGDLEFQSKFLDTLSKYALTKDIDPRSFAYLKDRVLLRNNEKQIFGTQFLKFDNDSLVIQEHISEDSVMMYRERYGLSDWEKYLNRYGLKLPSESINYNKNIVVDSSFEELQVGKFLSGFKNFYSSSHKSKVLDKAFFENSINSLDSVHDGNNASHIYMCYDFRNHDKDWSSRSIINGKLMRETVPGIKYEVSFYYYNEGANPYPASIQFAFLKDTLQHKQEVLSKGLKIDFSLDYSDKWRLYKDTIVVYDFYSYYGIGSMKESCNMVKKKRNPLKFGSSYLDLISVKAIREKGKVETK